jgi:hypothetical protein
LEARRTILAPNTSSELIKARAEGQPMQIPVLLEPIAGNGYRARGGEPISLSAEGATREEALQRLRELIQRRLHDGAELVALEVSLSTNPWAAMAGTFKENPLFEEWLQAMAENRRQEDAVPGHP